MGLSSDQMRIAGELGERLAAGDETSIEDIRAVMRPIIRAADEEFGLDVMMQIMFGMMAPSVYEAMGQRVRILAPNDLSREFSRLQSGFDALLRGGGSVRSSA
jgi:hypothetical protein